ncbi:protein jag [Gardnerella vaginalis]|uniref:Jag family protein n=1 Tax=Gardnerella TaxID=2701 RepID=UPI0039EE2681
MVQDEKRTVDQLNEEADIAADYLEGLLDIADYEGDIEMGVRNNRPMIQIVADDDTDIKNLIGRNGEVVDALQQLSRLAVQQKTGDRSHLIVDVDGFLKRKRQHLRDIALDAVDDVRETGEPVNLKPMNSFERKVVHDTVRDEGLRSRSHGEEPHRYVTVYMPSVASEDENIDEIDDVDGDYSEE